MVAFSVVQMIIGLTSSDVKPVQSMCDLLPNMIFHDLPHAKSWVFPFLG
jgi:hypothetical protein